MLQSLNHLCGRLLDSVQHVHISLVLRSPELATVLQVWPHQRWKTQKEYIPQLADNTLPKATKDSLCLLCSRGKFLLIYLNINSTTCLASFLQAIQIRFCISGAIFDIDWLFVTYRLLLLNFAHDGALIRLFPTVFFRKFVQDPVDRRMEGCFHGTGSICHGSEKCSSECSRTQKLITCWKNHTKIYTFYIHPSVSMGRLCSLLN